MASLLPVEEAPARKAEDRELEARFDLAMMRSIDELDDEDAALQRLIEEGYDVKAFLITPSPERLLSRFNAKVEMVRSVGMLLLAASDPVSMQSVQHVFSLCA